MNPVFAAALWMVGALVSFGAMAVAGRELSAGLSTFQILFWRGLVGLIAVTALFSIIGWQGAKTKRIGTHCARNALHFAAQYGWFFGIAAIPLAQVFAIEFTTPIWVMVMAALFLGEVVTRTRVLALALGFVGILIILRPGVENVHIAQLAVVGSAIGYASSYVFTKSLVETDTPLAIMFYMTLLQMPLALAGGLVDWAWPAGIGWFWAITAGVGGLSAHFSMAKALKLADATIVTPMDFLRLPLIAVVGYLIYNEPLEIWVLAGACIIFAGVFLNVRVESAKAR
jgi:drug/metabolite transporter (DMT)-like permease